MGPNFGVRPAVEKKLTINSWGNVCMRFLSINSYSHAAVVAQILRLWSTVQIQNLKYPVKPLKYKLFGSMIRQKKKNRIKTLTVDFYIWYILVINICSVVLHWFLKQPRKLSCKTGVTLFWELSGKTKILIRIFGRYLI